MKKNSILKKIVSTFVAVSFCSTIAVCVSAKSTSATFNTPYGTGTASLSGNYWCGNAETRSPVVAYKIVSGIAATGYRSDGSTVEYECYSLMDYNTNYVNGYAETPMLWGQPVPVTASYWSSHEVYNGQTGKGTYLCILNCD